MQVPDARNGWHTPNLREAFRGPGQLVGPVNLDTRGFSDVWSNDISDAAIGARQQEDAAEATAWQATKVAKGWTNGLPPDASAIDTSDFAIGTRREAARNARVYTGSLTKAGEGTLFLTGANTWHGKSTVTAGKLSVVGSHASAIDVAGGTLGGSGTVAGTIDVAGGVLAPGLAADEAARITDVQVAPGNVLSAGGNVRIGGAGRLAVTVKSDTDYTKLRADGDLVLAGPLALDVQGPLTPGTSLTIAKGRSVTGTFAGLPEGGFLQAGGRWLVASYRDNSVTLVVVATADGTVGGTVPATLSLTLGPAASFGAFDPGCGEAVLRVDDGDRDLDRGRRALERGRPELVRDRPSGQRLVHPARAAAGPRPQRGQHRHGLQQRRLVAEPADLERAGVQRRALARVQPARQGQRPAPHGVVRQDADVHALDNRSLSPYPTVVARRLWARDDQSGLTRRLSRG